MRKDFGQFCDHRETNQLIRTANPLNGFFMKTLVLIAYFDLLHVFSSNTVPKMPLILLIWLFFLNLIDLNYSILWKL